MKTSIEPGPPHSRRKSQRGRALFGLLAATLAASASVACSSNDAQKNTAGEAADAGDQGAGGGSAADSGNAAGSGNAADAGDSTAALCDTFFDALVKCPSAAAYLDTRGFLPQGLDKLPKTEVDRLRPLYRVHCTERPALPGSGFDSAHVSACLSAIQTEGCVVDPTTQAACTFKGTLPAGSACELAEQCADFDCFSVANCGGGPFLGFGAAPSCGVCRKAPAIGDACDRAQSCGDGAVCVVDPSSSSSKGVCAATKVHAAGEACDSGTNVCADGLYCDLPTPFGTTATSTCKAYASAGEACTNPGACKPPLTCSLSFGPGQPAAPGKCESSTPAAPGAAGAKCNVDSDCAADLGCVLTPSNGGTAPPIGGTCQALKFAEPGGACDATTHCRVGSCSGTVTPGADGGMPILSAAGTCPTVIADGGACEDHPPGMIPGASASNAVCDTLSSCVNGKCTPFAYPTCDATTATTAPLTCPDPLVVACPTASPKDGDACPNPTPATGQSVTYPSDCSYDSGKTHCGCGPSLTGPGPALSWSCETCPAAQPTPGDACGGTGKLGPVSPLQCAYADVTCGCNFGPSGTTWACGSCPASAPKTGDACADLPQGMECDFGGAKCTCSFGPPIPGGPSGATWNCQ